MGGTAAEAGGLAATAVLDPGPLAGLGPVVGPVIGAVIGPGFGPVAGLTLAALGAAWSAWAAWELVRAGNRLAPGAAPARFVDEGPFAWSRNPMALGAVLATFGVGLALGLPAAGAVAAVALAAWAHARIVHEERELQRRFGGWYSDYAARVRRWI
ncbi:MAG: isoprenylcysteine carboxylmethyltransferase family protein [Rubrivivax sp.]|nr:isoprenylcysteine carboxylmethyltransferase family protein [Rubrivivax sp.]